MKYILTIFSSLLLFIQLSFAQDIVQVPEFGNVTAAELQMKDCSFAPGAAAMNLLSYQEAKLSVGDNNNTKVIVTKRYRVKIFTSAGFKNANIVIDYSGEDVSKITGLQGATYNIDDKGQVVATVLNESDIYKDKSPKKDGRSSIRFTFPNVKQGSVLEYQFTVIEKDSYFIPSWFFQENVPTLLSACKVIRPVFSQVQKRIVADLPVEEASMVDDSKGFEKRELVSSYAMRNIPAFDPEPFMSCACDYEYRVDFLVDPRESVYDATIRNSNHEWSAINTLYLRTPLFGQQIYAYIPNSKSFIDSAKKLQDPAQKINAVYEYVKRHVKWNDWYYTLSEDLSDVWKRKDGNSAEINLSILNLLLKCGVQAYPVLYSTRWNGKVDYDFADDGQFNTVDIVAVNGKKFNLLDGTNPFLSFDMPPFNVINTVGMIIDENNNSKINVMFDRALFHDSISVSGSVDSNGILKGNISETYYDLSRVARLEEEKKDSSDASDNISSIYQPAEEIKIDSSYMLNKDNKLLPLIENSAFHYEMQATNDLYFLNPLLFFDLSKNPFTNSFRKTDIDFIANSTIVVNMQLVLEKGMQLEELTKNKDIQMPDSSITFSYENHIENDTLYINATMKINKPSFSKTEYPAVKKFFTDMYSSGNDQLLLRKKE